MAKAKEKLEKYAEARKSTRKVSKTRKRRIVREQNDSQNPSDLTFGSRMSVRRIDLDVGVDEREGLPCYSEHRSGRHLTTQRRLAIGHYQRPAQRQGTRKQRSSGSHSSSTSSNGKEKRLRSKPGPFEVGECQRIKKVGCVVTVKPIKGSVTKDEFRVFLIKRERKANPGKFVTGSPINAGR